MKLVDTPPVINIKNSYANNKKQTNNNNNKKQRHQKQQHINTF